MDEAIKIVDERLAEIKEYAAKTSEGYMRYMELQNLREKLVWASINRLQAQSGAA